MQEIKPAIDKQSNPIKDKKEKIQKQKILNEQEKIKKEQLSKDFEIHEKVVNKYNKK